MLSLETCLCPYPLHDGWECFALTGTYVPPFEVVTYSFPCPWTPRDTCSFFLRCAIHPSMQPSQTRSKMSRTARVGSLSMAHSGLRAPSCTSLPLQTLQGQAPSAATSPLLCQQSSCPAPRSYFSFSRREEDASALSSPNCRGYYQLLHAVSSKPLALDLGCRGILLRGRVR